MTQQSLIKISDAILQRMAEQRKQFPQYSTWHEAETVIEIKIRRASELLNKKLADCQLPTANLLAAFIDAAAHCLLAASECPSQKQMWAQTFDKLFNWFREHAELEQTHKYSEIEFIVDESIIGTFETFKHHHKVTTFPGSFLISIAAHCVILIPRLEEKFYPLITLTIPKEKESCNQI